MPENKHQTPISKHQINTNLQTSRLCARQRETLELGVWNLFGVWFLGFGVFYFAAMWNVLITARTMNETGLRALQSLRAAGANVIIPPKQGPLSEAELLPHLPNVDAVLASMDKFTDKVLSSPEAKSLKLISRWGVGYDAIDIPAATRNGVVVAYCPGMLNETVADYAFSLLCA